MRILISGICGFVGSALARYLLESQTGLKIYGFDNFSRAGSHLNRDVLKALGVEVFHADVRFESDMEQMPQVDWIVDAAANPSVLAGVDGVSSPRQVLDANLYGTINLLENARRHNSGFILLSSSRVYSISALKKVPLKEEDSALVFDSSKEAPVGVSAKGIDESFSTQAPISLYGATKLASEVLALEYAETYKLPVYVNRAGVIAGAGQFGKPDQGIFTYWINSYLYRKPLKYIGFGGTGRQLRDAMHPKDLALLVRKQMSKAGSGQNDIINVGGGAENAMSLKQLSDWCEKRFGAHAVDSVKEDRQLDIPWVVMDSTLAQRTIGFEITVKLSEILEEIAQHAEAHPEWLKVSGG
ncbi:MAG TPA: NAD-dependent epimerase/dehydratase family protein [Candidatus Melainabacteria bacterium]|nr:NAD-dependent epimerase/dehydratase family protein [Candidatus Melainabacteria bacterium]